MIVGISDYSGTDSDLLLPHMDTHYWHNYLTEEGYQTKILGDGRPEEYLTYHADATEANIDKFVKYAMSSADANDMVAITFAGHALGDGIGNSSFLTLELSEYKDSEIATALEENDNVGQVFLFFATCFSGGFGPEILAASNGDKSWVAANCTEKGFGWQIDTLPDLAWTYFFLNSGLMDEFDGQNISMEENFAFAEPSYTQFMSNYSVFTLPDDRPQEFDGNVGQPFLLSDESDGHKWYQPSEAIPSRSNSILGKNLTNYSKMAVMHINWKDGAKNKTTNYGEIVDPVTLQEVLRLLNLTQKINERSATCLFSHILDFTNNDGQIVSRIGICEAPSLRNNHPAVIVKVDENGETISRKGIVIPDAARLSTLLENNIFH